MKTINAPFQPSMLTAPARTLQIKIAGSPVRVPWSTPTRLWAAMLTVLLTGILFVLTVNHAVNQGTGAFKSIVSDCAPSIIAAQRIRTSLADFDANLVNELLCAPGSPEMEQAVRNAGARRHEFTEGLLGAAANITFGDAERQPLTTMTDQLGAYEAAMSRARALQEKGDLAGALTASREASRLMHENILPAAVALDKVNSEVLDRTYTEQQSRSFGALCWLVVTGLLCLAALTAAQWSLWRATRRRINPGLLVATLLTVGFLLYGTTACVRSSQHLKETTKDAFDSVGYLWKARAVAYDANGAESRWLYDRAQAAAHEQEFFEKAGQIAKAPAGVRLQEVASHALTHPDRPVSEGFTGLLAQELGNITYEGELSAAAESVRTFGNYLDVDKEIRRLEAAGNHARAVALCLSYQAGGSNAAFDAFDLALGKTLQINVDAFERFSKEGVQGLAAFHPLIPAFSVLAAFAVFVGFLPRMREYAP